MKLLRLSNLTTALTSFRVPAASRLWGVQWALTGQPNLDQTWALIVDLFAGAALVSTARIGGISVTGQATQPAGLTTWHAIGGYLVEAGQEISATDSSLQMATTGWTIIVSYNYG